MANGAEYNFELATSNDKETNPTSYKFVNKAGSFVIDVSNPKHPLIICGSLNNLVRLSKVFKNTSYRSVIMLIGEFAQTIVTLGLSGSWGLIADGSKPNPNNLNPPKGIEGITAVIISYNPDGTGPLTVIMKEDNSIEYALSCNLWNLVPLIVAFTPLDIYAGHQTSDFGGGGMTNWHLEYDTTFNPFSGYHKVGSTWAPEGSWSRDAGANLGTINIAR